MQRDSLLTPGREWEGACGRLLKEKEAAYNMCSLTTECVFLLQNVFSYYRMCFLTTECVFLLQNVFSYKEKEAAYNMFTVKYIYYKGEGSGVQGGGSGVSLTTECVFLLQNVFSYKEKEAAH